MANLYHAHVDDVIKQSSRYFNIIADNFQDAYGLARGACRGNEQVTSVSEAGRDVIICPQVAKDASKHA